jgi:hypothetical protein
MCVYYYAEPMTKEVMKVVNVDKDNRSWMIEVLMENTECPYLFFPNSIHGCKLLRRANMDDERCRLENCCMRIDKDIATQVKSTKTMIKDRGHRDINPCNVKSI